MTSIHGNMSGRYDYKMYAIHHPNATKCAKALEDLGYELIERTTPVRVDEIEGNYLRERIESNGCCGSKELIKLEAYTMTQYPIVVHVDLDFLFLKPIDVLFDVMLDKTGNLEKYRPSLDLMFPNQTMPNRVNAIFTRDGTYVSRHCSLFMVQISDTLLPFSWNGQVWTQDLSGPGWISCFETRHESLRRYGQHC